MKDTYRVFGLMVFILMMARGGLSRVFVRSWTWCIWEGYIYNNKEFGLNLAMSRAGAIMYTRALTDYFRQRFHGSFCRQTWGFAVEMDWEKRYQLYLLLGMYLCLDRGQNTYASTEDKIQCASLRGLECVFSVSLCSVLCVIKSE